MAGLQGRIFGGYELTAPLGSSGICDVYRARPVRTAGREAVVKIIHPDLARQPGFLPNFRRSTQMAGRLASHPHILPLLASGEESSFLYLISPLVADGTLKDWIVRGGRLGGSDAGPFFRQLCDALSYAHSLGVVHGDVKPSNIYLFEGRHLLLGDFGLLWDVAHMDMTRPGAGTEAVTFAAPEVAQGQVSQASDVYSVGAVLFTAITGRTPFAANTPGEMIAAHARQPVPSLAQAASGLPPEMLALDGVIQRSMTKRPGDRYPSAAAVAQAIENVTRQAAGPPHPGFGNWAPTPNGFGGQNGGGPLAGAPVPLGGMLGGGGIGMGAGGPMAPAGLSPLGGGGPGPFGGPPLGESAFGPPQHAPQMPFAGAGAPTPLGMQPQAGGGLQPLNFPPLPGEVDANMDQGRITIRENQPPTQPTARMPQPGAGPSLAALPRPAAVEPPPQPTMRVPAPQPPAPPSVWPSLDGPPAPPMTAPAGRSSLFGDGDGDGDPWAMPAVRVPAAAPNGGGFGDSTRMPAVRPDGDLNANGQRAGAISFPPMADDSREMEIWTGGFTAIGDAAAGESVEMERPFSPTELGLPRLTSPDLRDLPPSWQELVREAPRYGIDAGKPAWRDETSAGESAEWSVQAPAWGYDGESEELAAHNGQHATMRSSRGRNSRPVEPMASEEELDWADDSIWSSGAADAMGQPRRRWPRRVALVLMLVLVLNAAGLAVLRPDLCPISQCQAVSDTAHQYLPFLGQATPASAVGELPPAVAVTVPTGRSASAVVTFKSVAGGAITWSARSDLKWLTINPVTGSLQPGDSAMLTLTVNATDIKPGAYSATLTITASGQTIKVPVTITVK
ncbi:MAG TPA: protein kinase [Ktedonobacterales bacterium]|nr:protein kinase [Ktedonobacterales bacterium]